MPATAYPHIEIVADGTIYIDGTGFKLVMLLMERLAEVLKPAGEGSNRESSA